MKTTFCILLRNRLCLGDILNNHIVIGMKCDGERVGMYFLRNLKTGTKVTIDVAYITRTYKGDLHHLDLSLGEKIG